MPDELNSPMQPADQDRLETNPKTRAFGAPLQTGEKALFGNDVCSDVESETDSSYWQSVDTDLFGQPENPQPEPTVQLNCRKAKHTWQPLEELARPEDDLVNILQGGQDSEDDRKQTLIRVQPVRSEPKSTRSDRTEQDESKPERNSEREGHEPELVEVSDITFYLVPRNHNQYLIGALPHRLRRWLPELCHTYGWQLEALSVRPDYIKWTLGVFPESLTRPMLKIIRSWTSEKIFRLFPILAGGNATGDFWSPGYLVDVQSRDFSTQALFSRISNNKDESKNSYKIL